MARISDELDKLIAAQEAEIARLKTQARADEDAAKERLALLKRARTKVGPDLDELAEELRRAGVWPTR